MMSSCPSAEQLEQMLDEQLGDADQQSIALHVKVCADCQATLESLTANADFGGDSGTLVMRRRQDVAGESSAPFLARLKDAAASVVLASMPSGADHAAPFHAANGAASSPSALPAIAGYEIEAEIGRGGMGVVYKARQTGLNRLVALKMILAGPHARPRDLARFRQEAEAVASLHHPNIVQIHDIGEVDGIPYLVLEYVAEGNLVQHLRGDPQEVKPSVRFVETLARTIHFAHQQGVVHRDLKPANILLAPVAGAGSALTDANSPPSDGLSSDRKPRPPRATDFSPKITDFGLAKRLDEADAAPSGEIVGTPSYMAPEQAGGKAHLVGPATDVYALGAILYEMFTGRPPFKGATPLDTLVQVVHEEPVRPTRLRPSLPLDLETICLKCLSKDPARRFASAEALADDLQRYVKGKPILARPVGWAERAWKWSRRRPLTSALLIGMILSVVLGFAGITWQWQETRHARDVIFNEKLEKEMQTQQAEAARAAAIEERRRAQVNLYFSRIAQGQLQWRVNNVLGARESLALCWPLPGEEDQRGWEWHYLRELFNADLMTLRHGQRGSGGTAVFSPNGQIIASVIGGRISDDDAHPGEVRFWDAKSGDLLRALRVPGTAHRLAFAPDGQRFALATTDGSVQILDTATGNVLVRTPADGKMIPSLAFSPDGRSLALASWEQTVKTLDSATGRIMQTLKADTGPVHSVAFQPGGAWLAVGDSLANVRLWDLHTGKIVMTLRGHKSPVNGLAFSPDGKALLSGSTNGTLRIWDLATERSAQSLTSQSGAVFGSCFSPDGRYLAYCGGDATVRVWDSETGVARMTFRGHTAPVESVAFSPDGRRLVSFSPQEGDVKVWDVTRHPEYATFARARGRGGEETKVRDLTTRSGAAVLARTGPDIEALAFHADGKHLVSVAVGGEVQFWDANSGVLLDQHSVPMCDELITPAVLAAFDPGGTRLAGRDRADNTLVKIWDVATGDEISLLRGHTMPVFVVRFSFDGQWLVTCAADIHRGDRPHEIKVWNAATGQCLASLAGTDLLVNATFSPNGRWIAAGSEQGDILLGEWAASNKVTRFAGHKGHVAALAFNMTGDLLASAGLDDRQLKIWRLDGFDPSAQTSPRQSAVISAPPLMCDLAFTPDNTRLAGISRDVVKMWDVGTHHEVLSLRGAPARHWDPAFNPRVVFSADGKRLAGTNWNESISMWDIGITGDEGAMARHQLARRQAAQARAPFWHLEEAEDCVSHHNIAAARFHLQRLGKTALPGPLEIRRERIAKEIGP